MRTLAAFTLGLFLVNGTALADAPKNADAPGKPAARKAKTETKTEKADANFAAEIEELRQAIQVQQEQLQLLKEELAKRDREVDAVRESAATANAKASEANTRASEAANASAELKSTASTLNANISDLKTSHESLKATVATGQADAKKATEEGPSTIHYKGVSITPGGFFAAETVYRTRAGSADDNTPFTALPFNGNSLSKVSEINFGGRQSRPTLLVEGKAGSAKFTGYLEADFLGAGTTSNNRQSNSYVFRQRQAYAQVTLNNGFSVTGGQMWSLATETRKGITNRQEATPLVVDHQYNVGFTWARQYGLRLVKSFGDKFALGFSIEGPQTTLGGRGFSSVTNRLATGTSSFVSLSTNTNFFVNAPGASGGLFNAFDPTGYTTNKAPDFIFKAAFDPGWGHYEVFGILSEFRTRVYPCAVVGTNAGNPTRPATPTTVNCAADPANPNPKPSTLGAFNDSRTGGGGGVSARVPLFTKKLELAAKFTGGSGIGRYGSAQLADTTARPDGTLALIRSAQWLSGLEAHPNSKLDLYAYFGQEYAGRAAYTGYTTIAATSTPAIPATATSAAIPATTTTTISTTGIGGYGSPFANNSGCNSEAVPPSQLTPGTGGACAGDIRTISEGSVGFWHKFYNGPKGSLRWGLQYSYVTRSGWSGNNNTPGSAGISPKAVDNMIFTSFRYYLP